MNWSHSPLGGLGPGTKYEWGERKENGMRLCSRQKHRLFEALKAARGPWQVEEIRRHRGVSEKTIRTNWNANYGGERESQDINDLRGENLKLTPLVQG
jgi:hypothetical protein